MPVSKCFTRRAEEKLVLFDATYRRSTLESGNGYRITIGHADTWMKRLMGFKKEGLARTIDGLLIYPCSSIHTIGMTFEIDVYFLDKKRRLIRSYFNVRSGRCLFVPGAKYVLELKAGEVVSPVLKVGEYLNFEQ